MAQLSYVEIEAKAEEFLQEYNPKGTVPVPIERIVEIDLDFNVIPKKGLKNIHKIDAFLSADLTELYIDHDDYMNETNRGRFSLAHEIGHFVMHKEIVQMVTNIDDWKKRILGDGSRRALLENEANDFAGCVLMPRQALQKEYDQQMAKAEKEFKKLGLSLKDTSVVDSYIAVAIGKVFGVSQQAAEIRIYKAIKRK